MSYLENLFNLKDKTAVVTGGAGQLGSRISEALKGAGAHPVVLDIAFPKKKQKGVDYHKLDITKKEQVARAFGKIAKENGAIDILVNNAGVSVFEPFEKRKEKSIDLVMDVNLKAALFCIQSYVSEYDKRRQSSGAIVNIGSVYGVISPDYRIYTDCDRKNSEIYGTTKAGIIQMTKYFAVHLADRNIRVNAVSPGGIYNPVNPQGEDFVKNYSFRCPMKRMARDTEIGPAVIYLASDAASYTTGQNVIVDGGMTCW